MLVCSDLIKLLHWFPCLPAKMGLEKTFPPALHRSGVLFLGRLFYYSHTPVFIAVMAPRGGKPHPPVSSPLPFPPLEAG